MCSDLADVWRWTFLSKWFYAAGRCVKAPHPTHTQPTYPSNPTHPPNPPAVCTYSGGTLEDWLERNTDDILSREREEKKKKNWKEETSQFWVFLWQEALIYLAVLENKTLHEEIRNKEADCRTAPQACRWRTGLRPRERSPVTSIWTCS